MRFDFSEHLKSDSRSFWWNEDFKELLQKRAGLADVHKALDIGCGMGHWTREISSVIAPDAQIIGVDVEEQWLKEAINLTSSFKQRDVQFSFQKASAYDLPFPDETFDLVTCQQASAYDLPFPDETFDLVTCQTLLMHLAEPKKAIAEMLRVLKRKGKLILAEPNNYAHLVWSNTAQEQLTLEERLDIVKLYAMIEEGKIRLGGGRLGIGTSLPGLLEAAGCKNIRFYRGDKGFYLRPPYKTDEEKALIQLMLTFIEKDFFLFFPPDEMKVLFQAASDDEALFKKLQSNFRKLNEVYRKTIEDKTFEGTVGWDMLITMGEKP